MLDALPDWKTMDEEAKQALVRVLADQGMSDGQMARHFANATRNAVIGFRVRRKIELQRVKPHAKPKPLAPRGQKGQPKVNGIVHRASAMQSLPPMPMPVDETDAGVDVTQRIGLMDLTQTTCRWPVGPDTGAKQMFCGCYADLVATGPYCPAHTAKAEAHR